MDDDSLQALHVQHVHGDYLHYAYLRHVSQTVYFTTDQILIKPDYKPDKQTLGKPGTHVECFLCFTLVFHENWYYTEY